MPVSLPIDALLPEIRASLETRRHLVIVSPPGSGKTTRVPPSLVDDGPVVLLQPRRVAARSLARRIAGERNWKLGGTIGWQIRLDRNFSADTRLLVCTEGILTARLQGDPLLSEFRTVILDEFHERSIHADLGLAMLSQAAEARDDLRIIVMSATIDPAPIVDFLGGRFACGLIESSGSLHPVEIEHLPRAGVTEAVYKALEETAGDVLVFLPGMREIEQARGELRVSGEIEVAILHGSLAAAEQERAILPGARRKVILSTNIAETSLTVEGVEAVVDSGLHKVMRHDPESGIDRLVTERIPRDAADQRAGRAGRVRPGRAIRLWDERDILKAHREAEVQRIDLAAVILDVLRWGDDPDSFPWFERPSDDRIAIALDLLRSMSAVDGEPPALTETGAILQRLPMSPRLGRILIEANGSILARRACSALAEGKIHVDATSASDSDLLHLADARGTSRMEKSVTEIHRILKAAGLELSEKQDEGDFLRSVLAGYPDRVARRRESGSDRYQLCSGEGAVLSRRSSVHDAEWIVAVDIRGASSGREALIEVASRIEPNWLAADTVEVVHELDDSGRKVVARERHLYGSIVLEERPAPVEPDSAAGLLAAAFLDRPLDPENATFLRRMRFAGLEADLEAIVRSAVAGRTEMPKIRIADWLSWEDRQRVERDAPSSIEIPSGRRVELDYREDGSVVASAKLQELFGMIESPVVGPKRTPVTIDLLAPNGRSVQLTTDLRNFWASTYAEVRKELRGRYPKHPWPEDPSTAVATAKTKKQLGR